ncbi:hypothetical protein I8748_04340 [Nostoc sp. CENA67]|uniref:ATPase domain-containing protein n=1 Tax=Amazonocrinis nigriterrae CENA67 TaxID=2794033 RepID=A0A8J7HS23_9NOST|nr:ATP-binding protein [Amazonocrinis nigriterrae]MBH8561414.1 hypothetical protein [Amazonocrinis nigriterrae CENA67]
MSFCKIQYNIMYQTTTISMAQSISRRNPYIIGRPIDEPKLLFGRQDLFWFIEGNLKQGVKVTLLHGQRRIGKSSIIRNVPKFVKIDSFVFIPLNLEDYTHNNLYEILAGLAKDIQEYLQIDTNKIKLPTIQDLEQEVYIFYSKFLTKIYDYLRGRKIVLLIDEIEALIEQDSASVLDEFFNYLHSLIAVEHKLFLIIFTGRQSANMPNLLNYFQDASSREIGFLNQNSATELITQPAQGILEYEPAAIQAIIELSAGHPYFIQVICFAIFVRARELDKWHINLHDINHIVDKAIENAEAGLAWYWDQLTIPEKVVFSAVAESQKIAIEKNQKIPEKPLNLLKKYGVVKTEVIEKAVQELVDYNFLHHTGDKIKIELVRRWLLQRHPLRQEIKELEKFNEEENYFSYEAPTELTDQGNKQNNLVDFTNATTVIGQNYNLSKQVGSQPPVYFTPAKKRLSKSLNVGIIAGAMGISAIAGVGISHLSKPCFASESKVFGVFCVNNPSINFSSGDRTFFPIKGNIFRDQGIQSFKSNDYQAAMQSFAKAVADNPQDPEVLIYYNNARAKQQGNFFTLAVVVPADNNVKIAQEILRGVAQAQREFNDNNGLNGKLLYIIIANDGNGRKPEIAKEVAAELVKDKSVLAVIGQLYSESIQGALTEYQNAGMPVIPTNRNSSSSSYNAAQTFIKALTANADRTTILERLKNTNLSLYKNSRYPLFYSQRKPQSKPILLEIKNGELVALR